MSYNPLRSALSAAAAELSSPAAKAFYTRNAQQALQTAFILIVQFGCIAYALGQTCRQGLEDMEQSARPEAAAAPIALVLAPSATLVAPLIPITVLAIASITPAALPSFQPIALLNPAPSPKAKRTRKPAATKSSVQPTEAPVKGKRGRKPKAAVTV